MSSGYNDTVFPEKAAEDLFEMDLPAISRQLFEDFMHQQHASIQNLAQQANMNQSQSGMNTALQSRSHNAPLYGQGMLAQQGNQQCFEANQLFPNAQIRGFDPYRAMELVNSYDQQAQDLALTKMNPIARAKFEPIFKLLDIKIRCAAEMGGAVWLIAKMAKNGKMYRQSWGVDTTDPGGSLRVWDCMVSELMDTIARADGYDANTNSNPEVARQQVPSGAGNP